MFSTQVRKKIGILFFLFYFLMMSSFVFANELTSTSFIIKDPFVGTGGSFGTSASFQSFGSGETTSIGRGTSTSFEGRFGFLWFPQVNAPVLSAGLNILDVDLSWTASTGELGWNVGAYNVGVSTVSGSGYSFTNVGITLSHTYPTVTPGTYYYIVQTLDSFGNVIATSNEETVVVPQALSFSISDEIIGFGPLTDVAPRYATSDTNGTTLASTVAHTLTFATNAPDGYVILYNGPALSSTSDSISGATITADLDGNPGTEEFAISATTDGSSTISSMYSYSASNWAYTVGSDEILAQGVGPTLTENFNLRYLANRAALTDAGLYTSAITYTAVPTF